MKTKSAKRSLASLTFAFESVVVFFAMLAAFGLKLTDGTVIWAVGLSLSVLLMITPAFIGKPWSYWFGWALQIILLGIAIFTIVFSWLGYIFLVFSFIFLGLWTWAMIAGSAIDAANRVLEKQNEE